MRDDVIREVEQVLEVLCHAIYYDEPIDRKESKPTVLVI
jgi:hypothetical protein